MASEVADTSADIAIKYLEKALGGKVDEKWKSIIIFFVKNSKEVALLSVRWKSKGEVEGAKLAADFLMKKGIYTGEMIATLTESDAGKCVTSIAALLVGIPGEIALASSVLMSLAAVGLFILDASDVANSCAPILLEIGGPRKAPVLFQRRFDMPSDLTCHM